MSWLETISKKRNAEVMKWNIQLGDFVNLMTWFGDVWAEVLEVYGGSSLFIKICRNDEKYKTDMQLCSNVRKLCRKENISKIETCMKITKERTIKRIYPMNADAYGFQGDEHITE